MPVFTIEAKHETEVTYRVTADNFREALETLCNKELWVEYCGSPATFGPDERVMAEHGIELIEVDCYSDPSPTGSQRVERSWDYTEENTEEEDE